MRSTLIFISFIACMNGYSQNGKYPMGARNAGIGGASIVLQDHWSLFNNIGALALSNSNVAFVSYQNRFNISEFQVVGAGYVHVFEKVVSGVGFYRFGDDLFNEQRVNLAIGHKLDHVSLGLSIDYLQYSITTVGSKGALLFEFGGVAEITDKIQFGAHIFNVNQAKLSTEEQLKLPTVMKAGVSFKPSEQLMINIETEKDLDFDEVFRLGLEYQIVEKIYLRTGFGTEPFNSAFGVGFYPKQVQFDYSFSNDTNLGSLHEMSVSYLLGSK
ncbi:MAG: hypothetical protein GY816_07345 [Cytophagales bacterium]|nr:hypothetical protein [Cytophagales bacterium]